MTQQDFLLAAENYARALAAFEIAERASSEARYYSSTAKLVVDAVAQAEGAAKAQLVRALGTFQEACRVMVKP